MSVFEHKSQRLEQLCSAYVHEEPIGLVTGAGVTADSDVPGYESLVVRLYAAAKEQGLLISTRNDIEVFFEQLVDNDANKCLNVANPDELMLVLRHHLRISGHVELQQLVKDVLYRKVSSGGGKHKTVAPDTYRKNETLNALVTFCGALPGSTLARDCRGNRIETNPNVGGILTTNYDNLLEGSFGSKFGRSMLKPVARVGSQKTRRGGRKLPVYHVHGYVSYAPPKAMKTGISASEVLVLSQDDYFREFSDPKGFRSKAALEFISKYRCLFIGCSMKDTNLRRFLHHDKIARGNADEQCRHFAILQSTDSSEADYYDAVMTSYGVTTIWIKSFDEIEEIMTDVYTSPSDVSKSEWDALWKFNWRNAVSHVEGGEVKPGMRRR